MISRIGIVVIAVFVCLASAGFELGRRAETVAQHRARRIGDQPVVDKQEFEPPAASASASAIADITVIATRPFAEFYRELRAASPDQRIEWERQLQSMKDGPQKYAALTLFYRTLIQVDPDQALILAKKLSDDQRYPAARLMATVAPPRAMGKIAELLLTVPAYNYSTCSSNYMREVVEEWSAADPVSAAKFVENHGDETLYYVPVVGGNWAASDPVAAKQWLDREARVLGENFNNDSFAKWLEGYFHYDPASAIDFAVSHQDDNLLRPGLRLIAQSMSGDSRALNEFVDQLHGGARSVALQGVVDAAETEIVDSADEPVKVDDRALADWLLKFPIAESREAIANVMLRWSSQAETSLLTWLSSLPLEVRSDVASQYPISYSPQAEELNAIANMPDQQLGNEILEHVMKAAVYQRDEMLEALRKSHLVEAQKSHYASLIPPPKDDETP